MFRLPRRQPPRCARGATRTQTPSVGSDVRLGGCVHARGAVFHQPGPRAPQGRCRGPSLPTLEPEPSCWPQLPPGSSGVLTCRRGRGPSVTVHSPGGLWPDPWSQQHSASPTRRDGRPSPMAKAVPGRPTCPACCGSSVNSRAPGKSPEDARCTRGRRAPSAALDGDAGRWQSAGTASSPWALLPGKTAETGINQHRGTSDYRCANRATLLRPGSTKSALTARGKEPAPGRPLSSSSARNSIARTDLRMEGRGLFVVFLLFCVSEFFLGEAGQHEQRGADGRC